MTATEAKSLEDVLESLKDAQSVLIVGCGDCATLCQTGGEFEVGQMKASLEEAGKSVTGTLVPDTTCNILDVGRQLRQNKEALEAADAVLVMCCGTGVQSVAETVKKAVVPGCNTIFLSAQRRLGQLSEFCVCCGDCVVDEFLGICPRARCPKGQTTGPCGGYDQGKCEVDKEQDCVWTLIYKRAAEMGKQPEFATVDVGADDFAKQKHPRARVFEPRRG
jgi:hypothetical protein